MAKINKSWIDHKHVAVIHNSDETKKVVPFGNYFILLDNEWCLVCNQRHKVSIGRSRTYC